MGTTTGTIRLISQHTVTAHDQAAALSPRLMCHQEQNFDALARLLLVSVFKNRRMAASKNDLQVESGVVRSDDVSDVGMTRRDEDAVWPALTQHPLRRHSTLCDRCNFHD